MSEEENNVVEEQPEVVEPETGAESQDNNKNDSGGDNEPLDGDATVEKLQQRLSSKTAETHDLSEQLKSANELIEDLKSGKKSIKELASEDKQSKDDDEKDQRIKELEATITRSEAINETNAVFKEQGIVVNDDVVDMVVGNGTDNKSIFENVKALTDLINSTKEEARKEFLRGNTPRVGGKTTLSEGATIAKARNNQAVITNDPWNKK